MLGDFGAACFFDPSHIAAAIALQRLEVRAFGCLLEELLEHSQAAAEPAALAAWGQLQQQCIAPEPATRPLFSEIVRELERWQPAVPAAQTER